MGFTQETPLIFLKRMMTMNHDSSSRWWWFRWGSPRIDHVCPKWFISITSVSMFLQWWCFLGVGIFHQPSIWIIFKGQLMSWLSPGVMVNVSEDSSLNWHFTQFFSFYVKRSFQNRRISPTQRVIYPASTGLIGRGVCVCVFILNTCLSNIIVKWWDTWYSHQNCGCNSHVCDTTIDKGIILDKLYTSVETTHRDVTRMMVSVRSSDPPIAELFRSGNDCNLSGNTMFGCSTLYKPAITMHEYLVFGDYQFHFKQKSILSI